MKIYLEENSFFRGTTVNFFLRFRGHLGIKMHLETTLQIVTSETVKNHSSTIETYDFLYILNFYIFRHFLALTREELFFKERNAVNDINKFIFFSRIYE